MKTYIFTILLFFLGVIATAQISLPPFFTNNMVIQRDQKFPVWGKAQPNTIITVRFATTTLKTSSDKNGNWKVLFPKQKTTLSPKKLEIQNLKTSITLSNILVGDVWLCIGQSNMEWPMQAEMHYKEELTEVNNPKLRFFNTTYAGKNIYGQPFTDSCLLYTSPSPRDRG